MPRAVFYVVTAWLTPVMAVAAFSGGLPFSAAVALGAVLAAATSAGLNRLVAQALSPVIGEGRTWLIALFLVLSAVSVVHISRASLFAADANRVACSVLPGDAIRLGHSCVSAYVEAARFASREDVNIYVEALYQPRTIGGLNVDTSSSDMPMRAASSAWNGSRLEAGCSASRPRRNRASVASLETGAGTAVRV